MHSVVAVLAVTGITYHYRLMLAGPGMSLDRPDSLDPDCCVT